MKMKPEMHNLTSQSFMKLYESLPPETRQQLVEKKLAPLLDRVPKERALRVLKSAKVFQTKLCDIPKLQFREKKKEINDLLDELTRDSKRAIVRERSNREEIISEIIDSIVKWLHDIWTVVYEYNVHFEQAHSCLLFVADVLNTISNIPGVGGQCRCSISYHAISVVMRRRGKIVKKFTLPGPRHIDRVLLWIWRDLFVSMFAKARNTERIPEMLAEIEETLNWEALERMLYGGSKSRYTQYDDDDEEDEDGEDDVSDSSQEEQSWACPCRLHGSHWSDAINEHHIELRDLAVEHFVSLFELTPSHKLYSCIMSLSDRPDQTETQLLKTLNEIAGTSADTLVCALDIYGSEEDPVELMSMLDKHSYLLRPRDAPVLQASVSVLTGFSSFHSRALQIAERELLDAAAAVHAAVRSAFPRVDDKASTAVLLELGKLRSDSLQRRQRVDAWVDSVAAPGGGTGGAHPMAFAAMIMGFPFAAGLEDSEDADLLGYLDLDPRDPDLQDLREEFRPKLRERFEGWVSTVAPLKGGPALLGKVYFKIVDEMPYFKMNDVADEMLTRIGDRPNKTHIADAIDSLLGFCKTQRKKLVAMAEKRRKKEAAKKSAAAAAAGSPSTPAPAASSASASDSTSVPSQSATYNLVSAGPSPPLFGGMDDVD